MTTDEEEWAEDRPLFDHPQRFRLDPREQSRLFRRFACECARLALSDEPVPGVSLPPPGVRPRRMAKRLRRANEPDETRLLAADAIVRLVAHMTGASWEQFAALRIAIHHLGPPREDWTDGEVLEPEANLAWALTEPDARRSAEQTTAAALALILRRLDDPDGDSRLEDVAREVFAAADGAMYEAGDPPYEESGYAELPDEEKEDRMAEWDERKERLWAEATPTDPIRAAIWPLADRMIRARAWTDWGYDEGDFVARAREHLCGIVEARIREQHQKVFRDLLDEPRRETDDILDRRAEE